MTALADTFRAHIDRHPTARAIVKARVAQHAIQTARAARIVRPAGRFLVGQFGPTTGARSYCIGDKSIRLRHRTRDVAILNELFGSPGIYEPPADVVDALAGPLRVLDLGGNIGLFGVFALREWDIRELVSYEPDPANRALLEETAREHAGWTVVPAAVGASDGTLRFHAGEYADSRQARPDEPAITVPLVDVFREAPCDLLKMDIEGGEWPILEDKRLRGFARVIVLEWHAATMPDAHVVAPELLVAAGYEHVVNLTPQRVDNGMLWAWR